MKVFIYDVDDTLIIHSPENTNYYEKTKDTDLQNLIKNTISDKNYIYTNGTYGHGQKVKSALLLDKEISKVFSRTETLPYIKPNMISFLSVQRRIIMDCRTDENIYFFFDDMVNNHKTAKDLGWITIWVSPNFIDKEKYSFIDYAYPNIFEALLKFQT